MSRNPKYSCLFVAICLGVGTIGAYKAWTTGGKEAWEQFQEEGLVAEVTNASHTMQNGNYCFRPTPSSDYECLESTANRYTDIEPDDMIPEYSKQGLLDGFMVRINKDKDEMLVWDHLGWIRAKHNDKWEVVERCEKDSVLTDLYSQPNSLEMIYRAVRMEINDSGVMMELGY